MMAVIEVKDISKRFDNFLALDKVSLSVEEGDFFGLFGPNGAGKTTLLRILTGQIEATSGFATVLGIDVNHSPIEVKKRIGIVPESETPPSFLTASEFLYFVGRVRRIDDVDSKVDYWLNYFELKDKESSLCKDLSKGMRQRIMLASAFIHSPKLLFLDEPFINLDPIFQRKVRGYLTEYVREGGSVFMCSHILEIAEKLCNKIAIINNGKIIGRGKLEDLRVSKDDTLEQIFLRLVERG